MEEEFYRFSAQPSSDLRAGDWPGRNRSFNRFLRPFHRSAVNAASTAMIPSIFIILHIDCQGLWTCKPPRGVRGLGMAVGPCPPSSAVLRVWSALDGLGPAQRDSWQYPDRDVLQAAHALDRRVGTERADAVQVWWQVQHDNAPAALSKLKGLAMTAQEATASHLFCDNMRNECLVPSTGYGAQCARWDCRWEEDVNLGHLKIGGSR